MNYKLLIIAGSGFEDTELITTTNILKRAGIKYTIASIENKEMVHGKNEAIVATTKLDDLDPYLYDGLFLPGGSSGVASIEKTGKIDDLVKGFSKLKKDIYAICAAPKILFKNQILKEEYTAYPGIAESKLKKDKSVVVSKNIITGRSMNFSVQFALSIVSKVLGKEKAFEIEKTL